MSTIAFIAGSFPLPSETFVYREVRALRQRGWTVRTVGLHPLIKPNPPDLSDLERDTITIYGHRAHLLPGAMAEFVRHPLPSMATLCRAATDAVFPGESTSLCTRIKTLGQAVAALSLARELRPQGGCQRDLGCRHIHCHFAHAPATVGMYAARQLGITFSFTGHANDIFQRRALLKIKLRRAAFVCCISQWHREFYGRIFPDQSDRYAIIRCGVDVETWKPADPASACGATLRILTVCRLVEKKGLDTLLRALAILRDQQIAAKLTIAGDGPDGPRLRKLADDLKLAGLIDWRGAVSNETVHELMGQADCFALPCRTDARGDKDGIPVVLMEAMACGVPAISGDLPAIRELIEDGQSGFLIGDERQLADRLSLLWRDAALRGKMAQSARQRVELEFSLASNIDRLESRLRNAIHS